MRVLQTIFLFFIPFLTHAQLVRPPEMEYSTVKGLSVYAMMHGGALDQPGLATALQDAASAAPGKWAVGFGLGTQYQFGTGTAIRGEVLARSWGNSDAGRDIRLGSILVDLAVKQQFFLHSVAQPFIVAGVGSLEQNLRSSFPVAPGAGIAQTLGVPNTSVVFGSSGYGLVGAGLHLASWAKPAMFLAEFAEVEFSYRFPMGRPIWSTTFAEEIPFAETRWSVFAITLKAGLTFRAVRRK